jgi:DMSO/TMAO reductase YedYZ molybdopterin-dependent catalytic subunit
MTTPTPEPTPNPQPAPVPVPTPVVTPAEKKDVLSAEDREAIQKMRLLSRRAFAVGGLSFLAGFGALSWLGSRSESGGLSWPFRKMHEFNESVGRALYSNQHRAPEFDASRVGDLRVNGWVGWMESPPKDWKLEIEIPGSPIKKIALDELKKLPRVESIFEHKCVEGWSQIVKWGGYRFADFLEAFELIPPAGSPLQYLLLTTMDGAYTAALDLPSALHPQALLCDSLNDAPLSDGHGAPIRLVLPVKYGIKNIKWLAKIQFLQEKPSDYWTDRGYDWYAGL